MSTRYESKGRDRSSESDMVRKALGVRPERMDHENRLRWVAEVFPRNSATSLAAKWALEEIEFLRAKVEALESKYNETA